MLKKLKIGTVSLPTLYVAQDKADVKKAREHGLPFVRIPAGWDETMLIKVILFNYLEKKFPHILWSKVLFNGSRKPFSEAENIRVINPAERVVNVDGAGEMSDCIQTTNSDEYRETVGQEGTVDLDKSYTLDDYLGYEWKYKVSIEALQALNMMPSFMDDIADSIKHNIMSVAWADGWNKKLNAPLGTHAQKGEAPNLMVLDTSGSIPSGVASTMVSLIDTLREQANADLIITGRYSWWFGIGDELPHGSRLTRMIGGGNEIKRFSKILNEHVAGKHYGNLIVFGDDDSPSQSRFFGDTEALVNLRNLPSSGAKFDNILAFHTSCNDKLPGFGRFAVECSPNVPIQYSHDWINSMYTDRW